ncbi:uncharacterized protein [Dendrobates tinctorius]|uniref:uncharacterized protein n=1 Tax=Dendrobates tinctorius TaxID=92724 RepID=UPI003CCA1050
MVKFIAECELENQRLDSKFFNRERERLKNILQMVDIFHRSVSEKSKNDCCDVLEIGCKVREIDCNQVSVAAIEGDLADVEQDREVGGNFRTDVEDVQGKDVPLKIDDSQAQIRRKVRKSLLEICKIIPAYDNKLHVCRNSEVFESCVDKFDLSNEENNQLFKMWIPVTFSRRLSLKLSGETHENLTDKDRLKILIFCSSNENHPDIDILQKLRIGRKECIFTFMSIYERLYRMLSENVITPSLIRSFVSKFWFLNPASRVIASQKDSLFECAQSLDFARKHENRERKVNCANFVKTGRVKSYQKPVLAKPSKMSFPQNQIYEEQRKRKSHVCYKPYGMMQKNTEKTQIELRKMMSFDLLSVTKMAEFDSQKQVVSDIMACKLNTLLQESISFKMARTFQDIFCREISMGLGIG